MYVYKINKESKAVSYMQEKGLIFVNRYKLSHASARKMLKESKVIMVDQSKEGFTYKLIGL